MIRQFCLKAGVLLTSVALCGAISGCDGGSGLEKPSPQVDLQPDMNKMPGFKEMQDQVKQKKSGKAAPAKAADTPAEATAPK